MDESVQVKSIFNDIYVLFNANKGVLALYDKYKDSNLFIALIGNLDLAVESDANAIMKETYAFYKRYADRELSEADWDVAVEDFKCINNAWDNQWCKEHSPNISYLGCDSCKMEKFHVDKPRMAQIY